MKENEDRLERIVDPFETILKGPWLGISSRKAGA